MLFRDVVERSRALCIKREMYLGRELPMLWADARELQREMVRMRNDWQLYPISAAELEHVLDHLDVRDMDGEMVCGFRVRIVENQ